MSAKTKIKITRYPYKDHQVGDIVDFGHEKNQSLVSLQRAVWYEGFEADKVQEKYKELDKSKEVEDTQSLVSKPKAEDEKSKADSEEHDKESRDKNDDSYLKKADVTGEIKDITENKIRKKIQEKSGKKNSFWDNLK